MTDTVIRVENLSKQYRIGLQDKAPQSIRQVVTSFFGSPFKYLNTVLRPPTSEEIVWALKDVSFEVKQGEVIGVIGRNGAGKSTLLKILSRITEPTTGYAEIRGRVASLLEVGAGFHPELTGRENIYLNGTIMGMKKREIDRRFDEIVDFAGVEKYIDTPVKRYSSGMYVRLAFAVAAHLEPEILIVDEVLAVGDAAFQKKCLGKMQDATRYEGRTILFVTHSMSAVQELCRRGIFFLQGSISVDGSIDEVIAKYLQQWTISATSSYQARCSIEQISQEDDVLVEAEVLGADGKPCETLKFGEPFSIHMIWYHVSPIQALAYAIRVYDSQNRFLCATNTLSSDFSVDHRGEYDVLCKFDPNVLVPGEYYLSIGAYIRPHKTLHIVEACIKLIIEEIAYNQDNLFNVVGSPIFSMPTSWILKS
jgi:lipopolysaccharide transport system ATP-binding protein